LNDIYCLQIKEKGLHFMSSKNIKAKNVPVLSNKTLLNIKLALKSGLTTLKISPDL